MENQAPEVSDNAGPVSESPDPMSVDPSTAPAESSFTWKSNLPADLQKSPTMQKFADSPEGLQKAVESHLSLEKMLGHDKVPIPKDANDVEGWSRFSKAMGIPDKAESYGLPDVEMPGNMKDMTFNKQKFAEIVHAHKLTPGQAKGLWDAYTKQNIETYNKYVQENQKNLTSVVNQLRSEWGDGYEANVELGQMVINKFAGDKDTEDFLTASMTKDPRFIKFLARVGNQFAENKVGDFSYKRFSLTPEQADAEISKIIADPKHPYNNERAPQEERNSAIDYVNSLYASKSKGQG